MHRTSCASWLILGLLVISLSPPPALARMWRREAYPRVPNSASKQPTAESVTVEGTIQGITSAQIEVLCDTPAKKGKSLNKNAPHGKWTVSTPHDTPIRVVGEAKLDYLRPGLLVQFTAKAEDQEVKEPIHELTIVTAATAHAASLGGQTGNKHGPDEPAPGTKASKITGQLGHFHDNRWPVHVGDKTLLIELADNVKIKVALSGRRLVGSGDKIVVHGEMIHGKPGACVADDVQVTLSKPLSAPKGQRKPPKPPSEADPSSKDDFSQ